MMNLCLLYPRMSLCAWIYQWLPTKQSIFQATLGCTRGTEQERKGEKIIDIRQKREAEKYEGN